MKGKVRQNKKKTLKNKVKDKKNSYIKNPWLGQIQ